MKYFFVFILLFFSKCFGQNISVINKTLELSDSLTFENEIRIYKDFSIANGIEIFRMYDEGGNNWKATIYHYSKKNNECTKIEGIEFPKEKIGNLEPKNPYLIWLNILLCDVESLPNLKDVKYKLKKSSIVLEKENYEIEKEKTKVCDGVVYDVFVSNHKQNNHFIYDNPETYLELYPNVDELISFNNLLSIIKKEFNLWED